MHLTFNLTQSAPAPYGVVNTEYGVYVITVSVHLHVNKEKVAYAPPFAPLPLV